jgi:membrane-associated PAP2 superfamily phosphatase
VAIKFGTVGAVLCSVTLIPMLCAYAGLILFSNVGGDYMIDHVWVWGAIIIHMLLIVVVLTSVSLAFSSITTRRFTAAFGLIIAYFITIVMSSMIVNVFNEPMGTVVSIYDSVQLTGAGMFGVEDVQFDYWWGYNVISLVVISTVSTLVVLLKVHRTELSE